MLARAPSCSNTRAGKRCDFHFTGLNARLNEKRHGRELKEPPTERRERVRISLDHFDRAGSPLCVYYVFIMAAYQESRDKTTGASRTSPFTPPRDSLWRPFHITFENPGVSGRGLINWHRDTCPAGLGGPLAFNDTRQSHRFQSLSSMIAIARLTEG